MPLGQATVMQLEALASRLNEDAALHAAFSIEDEGVRVRLVADPGIRDLITCRRREGHGLVLWFFSSWQHPIGRASEPAEAVAEVLRYLTARP